MVELGVAHYKAQKVILLYVGMLVILLSGMFSKGDVTYTRFLMYSPELYLLYLCWMVVAWLVVWRLPYFVRAIFRVPALEYDGRRLTIRNWDTYQIPTEDLPDTLATFGKGDSIILKAPHVENPISIDLRFVWERPATSLIERLTLRPIAPYAEFSGDQPLMTDKQKSAQTRRKGAGYFLIGIGLPVSVAFTYPLLPSRGGAMIDLQSLSTSDGWVFLIGGSVGVVMSAIGYLMLKAGRRR